MNAASGGLGVSGVRAYLSIEADGPVGFYTGKLVKTLLYLVFKELSIYRGLRGVVSPIHVSPLFAPGRREWELGEVVTPFYVRVQGEDGAPGRERLEPIELGGEYIVHIGGEPPLVEKAAGLLERVRTPLQVRVEDVVVTFRLEKLEDVTGAILEKSLEGDRATLYLKAPAKLFNVYAKSRLPKFGLSAVEVLMAPYMILTGQYTLDARVLLSSLPLLGSMVETYYSLNTVKPVLVPFNGRKTPAMMGRITYIFQGGEDLREMASKVLAVAEIAGIGQSRQNGFGTAAWRPG